MSQDNGPDGIGGTDNVLPLFTDRPTAAPAKPQEELIGLLQALLTRAETGGITGLAFVAWDAQEGYHSGLVGKVTYLTAIGGLEDLKIRSMLGAPHQ